MQQKYVLISIATRIQRLAAVLAAVLVPASIAAGQDVPDLLAARLAAADADKGAKVFLQCAACHVSQPGAQHTLGPNLWGVLGRPIASQPGFNYSESLAQVSGQWDYATLDRYLQDPKSLAPQGAMMFPGVKSDAERADLIAYLRTLSSQPVALPEAKPGASAAQAAEPAVDDAARWQGLPPGPGREEVYYACNACHSLMIVKQQGLSRERWDETLVWMVEEQGMRPFDDAAARNLVLDYLSKHFGAQ